VPATSPKTKCEVATIRLAYERLDAGETRIEVLLSERSLESDARNRTKAPSNGGLVRGVVMRNKAEMSFDEGCCAFSAQTNTGPSKMTSSQPLGPEIDPLFLFVCGLSWGRDSNTSAGWELVRCLRTPGQTAQVAATLLVHAGKKGIRHPVRLFSDQGKPPQRSAAGPPPPARQWLR
jgi:hypothetical protein